MKVFIMFKNSPVILTNETAWRPEIDHVVPLRLQ